MDLRQILHSETTAWAAGAAIVALAAALAFAWVGWLGIGVLGLLGLVVSTRLDLDGGYAVSDISHGASEVGMYARQLQEQDTRTSPEDRLAAAAERVARSRVLYLINTVFIAMTALGLGLFVRHQL